MALTKLTQNLIDGTIVTSVNGSSGAVTLETGTDWQTAIQTSNFTAVAGKGYFVNTTSAEITVTLPAGTVGNEVIIQDYAGTFATNKVIFASNGSENIQGVTDDFKCVTNNATVTLIYQDATKGWTADNILKIPSIPLTISYLVVAGGGGGNKHNGGGGGAGGYRASYNNETSGGGDPAETALTLAIATNYIVTVGAGGTAGTTSANYYRGTNGNNSVFATITSIGGGEAGARDSVSASAGANGGSGGGGGSISTGGNAAGSGTASQGYAGGVGQDGGYYRGGGGGGAGAVGVSSASGGTGGAGVVSTITGSSVTRAGGGGAGANSSPGGGGAGGGGAGTASFTMNSGAANTGGGGGSGGMSGTIQGGLGGSGIVILRYPSAYTVSGLSGTTTTIGTDKVTTFTSGTGNIQFN